MTTPQYPSVLTEDQVRRIISRAVELDQNGLGVPTEDLSVIAAEAGISQDAIRAAMADVLGEKKSRQHGSGNDPEGPRWRHRALGLLRTYVVGGSGLALGAATWLLGGPVGSDIIPFLGVCLGGLGALKIALDNRRSGSQERYQVENLVLWLAWLAGWTISKGLVQENTFALITIPWGICAGLGGLVTSLRRPHLEHIVQFIRKKSGEPQRVLASHEGAPDPAPVELI